MKYDPDNRLHKAMWNATFDSVEDDITVMISEDDISIKRLNTIIQKTEATMQRLLVFRRELAEETQTLCKADVPFNGHGDAGECALFKYHTGRHQDKWEIDNGC